MLQCCAVLSVVRPVTHTADAAVKRESMKGVKVCVFEEIGRLRSVPPRRIIAKMTTTNIREGRFLSFCQKAGLVLMVSLSM